VLAYLVERTPNLAFLLLQIAVFGFGAVKCFHGELTIGSLVAFNVMLGYLSTYVTSLTRVMPPLLLAAGGVKRIQELLDTPRRSPSHRRRRPRRR
jgi:ATP-binding cassette subfamily B protein